MSRNDDIATIINPLDKQNLSPISSRFTFQSDDSISSNNTLEIERTKVIRET